MYIYWLGESSFKIKTEYITIIIDPADKSTKLPQPALRADITILTNTLAIDKKRIEPAQKESPIFTIEHPGEYETKGVFVYGTQGKNGNILYLIKTEKIKIAHLAGLSGELNDKQLELLEDADIALVPVGNKGILSGKQADKVINQLEPRIVIPMNYQLPKLGIEREPVENFLSEMGVKNLKPETSLHITKSKLPEEETKIVLLQV